MIVKDGDVLPREIMAQPINWGGGVELFMRQITVGEGQVQAKPIEFRPVLKGVLASPFLILEPKLAQNLIDELWKCGFRPSEGSGSAGMLKATQNHLEDMRKIAFNRLKIGE